MMNEARNLFLIIAGLAQKFSQSKLNSLPNNHRMIQSDGGASRNDDPSQ